MSYADEVLADSPLCWLRLNETSGTSLADSSGYNRPWTATGGPTLGLTGPMLGAVGLDGVDDYLQRSQTDGSWFPQGTADPFTVEAWVRAAPGMSGILFAHNGNGGGVGLFLNPTAAYPYIHGRGYWTFATLTETLTDGAWHHIVFAYDGGTVAASMRIYLDGVQQATPTRTTLSGVRSDANPYTIGRRIATGVSANWLDADVADFAVYGTQLSLARAQAHYSAAAGPTPPSDLTATATGSTTIDLEWADNSLAEDGYTLQRCTGPGCSGFADVATLPADTTTHTDTGLTPGTSYTYRVRATDGADVSAWSATSTATTGATGGSVDPDVPDDRPNTGPFAPEVAEVINSGVVEITGRIRFPGTGAAPVELAILDGRLSWSERRSPRFRADLDVAIPDPDVIALIDPRALVRVDVKIGYRLPDGSLDEQVVATPHLRDRRIIRPAEVLRLELAGDEALVIDAAAVIGDVDSGVWDRPKTDVPRSVAQLVTGLLSTGPAAYPPIVYQVDKVGTGEDVPWPPNDYWDGLEDLLEQIGAELAVDDGRTFVIRRRPTTVEATSAFMLRTGVGGVVLESDSAASRADWANQVVLTHRWTDAAGDTHTVQGVATVTGGPFTPALAGLRTYTERRNTPITEGGATKAAQTLLRRMLSRSRSYVMSAPSAYWLRPGHTVTVDLDAADSTRHLVAEVDHSLADGRMRVTTRLPDTASTIGE